MKFYSIALWVIMGLLCHCQTSELFAQCGVQRTLINDLTTEQQCELRNLMLDYLSSEINPNGTGTHKYPIVAMHHNPPVGSFSDFHNYNEEFATWHTAYIRKHSLTPMLPYPSRYRIFAKKQYNHVIE